MTKFLVQKIFGLIILLAICIVGYNYYWGNQEEQASSKKIIDQVMGLTGSVTELLQSEKEKYDQGKYDEALGKMKKTFSVLKEKALAMGESGKEVMDKVKELEQREKALEDELASLHMEDGDIGGGLMMASPGSEGESGGDEPSAADRAKRAEEIRQELMQLNAAAESLTTQLSQE